MEPDHRLTSSPRHRPRPSRSRRILGSLAAIAVATAVLAGCLSDEQVTVQKQINNSRAASGIAALADYQPADSKAQAWAEHLASIGRLEHSNLTSGYQSGTWCRLGENVGMGPSLASIHNALMASSGHRANILNRNYDHVGTGVVKKGNTYYVVQEFVDRC